MKMPQMMKDSLLTKFSTLCSQNDYNKLRKFNSKLKIWYSNRCTTLFEKECTYRFWLADYYFLIKVVYKTVNLYYSFPEDQIKIISWSYQQKTNWQRVKYIWFKLWLSAEVLHTPSSTRPGFKLMTSRSRQYIPCHWDACSKHSAISDCSTTVFLKIKSGQ